MRLYNKPIVFKVSQFLAGQPCQALELRKVDLLYIKLIAGFFLYYLQSL